MAARWVGGWLGGGRTENSRRYLLLEWSEIFSGSKDDHPEHAPPGSTEVNVEKRSSTV